MPTRPSTILLAALAVAVAVAVAGCGGGNDTSAGLDAAPARPRFAFTAISGEPCPALADLYGACGIAVASTYVDDCRRNFGGTSPDNLAFRCSEACVYGDPADSCEAVRARDNSRRCVACCSPVLRGGQPTCGLDGGPPDAPPPAPSDDGGAGAGDGGPSCLQRACVVPLHACTVTPGCSDLLDCLVECTTKPCRDACYAKASPDAAKALQDLFDCNDTACPMGS